MPEAPRLAATGTAPRSTEAAGLLLLVVLALLGAPRGVAYMSMSRMGMELPRNRAWPGGRREGSSAAHSAAQ